MGTLCKNCPFKGVKRTEGSCTELFAKKFHNSCVTYDISKHVFLEELKEFEEQKKTTEIREMTEEEQKEFDETVQEAKNVISLLKMTANDETILFEISKNNMKRINKSHYEKNYNH